MEVCGYKRTTQGTLTVMKSVCMLAVVMDAKATYVIKVYRTRHTPSTHTRVQVKLENTIRLEDCINVSILSLMLYIIIVETE